MITLHRLGGEHAAFHLNPDLILTIESTPDCMVALTTGTKLLVEETPDQVADAVREFRVRVLEDALNRRS